MEVNPKEELNNKPMNGFQCLIIAICIFLNIIDGFDVMVMAFTASSVSAEWNLTGAELGALLSSGLFGMAFGSLFLAPWADKIGRRPLILICLSITGLSMIAASLTPSALYLGLMRFITGLGIGGILASSNVIVSEYTSNKWRNLSVSLQSTGYAIGATVGGLISIYLIHTFGWRAVFLAGGISTLLMILVTYLALPESLDFLITKQPKNSLSKINQLCIKLNLQPILEMPNIRVDQHAKSRVSKLFSHSLRLQTVCLWLSFFLVMFGFYFVMSWTPKIVNSAGMTTDQSVTAGVFMSAGGIFGALLMGIISSKIRIFYVQVAFLAITAIFILAFVNSTGTVLNITLLLALLLGIMINGSVAGLYAISPTLYATDIRATGVGYAIGFGRIGGIISPLIAGFFLDTGIAPITLYQYYAVVFVLAVIIVLILSKSNAKLSQSYDIKGSTA